MKAGCTEWYDPAGNSGKHHGRICLTVDTRKEYADIVQEILNGKIDFMVCEQSMADNYTTAYDELTSFPLGVGEDSAGNAIAFQKGSELKAEFDKEILAMKESGELQDLIDKWFK